MLQGLVADAIPVFTMAHIDAKQLLEAHRRLEVATREPPKHVLRVAPTLRLPKGAAASARSPHAAASPQKDAQQRPVPGAEGAADESRLTDEAAHLSSGVAQSTAAIDAMRDNATAGAARTQQPLRMLLTDEQLQAVQVRAGRLPLRIC